MFECHLAAYEVRGIRRITLRIEIDYEVNPLRSFVGIPLGSVSWIEPDTLLCAELTQHSDKLTLTAPNLHNSFATETVAIH
jgi:hypothetical protein